VNTFPQHYVLVGNSKEYGAKIVIFFELCKKKIHYVSICVILHVLCPDKGGNVLVIFLLLLLLSFFLFLLFIDFMIVIV